MAEAAPAEEAPPATPPPATPSGPVSNTGRGGEPSSPSKLKYLDEHGDGHIYFEDSRRLACVISVPRGGTGNGRMCTFYANNKRGTILATFDQDGCGSINYRNGKPWVVVTKYNWTCSDEGGNIASLGQWPRNDEPIVCEVTDYLTAVFVNRHNITVTYQRDGLREEFFCGEKLKRDPHDTYFEKVTGKKVGGPLQLDVDQIKARQTRVGSLYVPPGPHHEKATFPGVGILPTLVKGLDQECDVMPTIQDLKVSDDRIKCVNMLPKYMGPPDSSMNDSLKTTANIENFGSPVLSETQRLYKKTMRTPDPNNTKAKYKLDRKKLPLMNKALFDQLTGDDAPGDELIAVCVLADWVKGCARLEDRLQQGHSMLADEAAQSAGNPASHVRIYKMDGSESRELFKKYDFRTVPMFLFFYNGHLVYASNKIYDKDELYREALDALTRGRKKQYLPAGFTFRGHDNAGLLESIHSNMVLRPM